MGIRIVKSFLIIIVLSGVFSFEIGAQEQQEGVPLVRIFRQLQKDYNLEFNYALDNIEGVKIAPPKNNLSLTEVIEYLRVQTGLVFEMLSEKIALVKSPDEFVLCGFIKDKDDLTPLSAATVQSPSSSVVTDDSGFFRITLNSREEEVLIRHLGYRTIERSAQFFNWQTCDDVFMVPFFDELQEVVIANYIVPGVDKLNSGDFSINIPKFSILPGLIDADVLQSVQSFPGIMSVNETVSNINIRGGTNDQNLILWDGIKMYQSGHFFGLISMYNPQITDKVILTKNGTDVGLTDGVSGSISMLTSPEINSKLKLSAGLNLVDFNAFADIPLGQSSSFQLAARKSISEWIETPTYNRFFDRIAQDTELAANQLSVINSDEAFDFYDTSLRWLYRISEKDELRVNFILVANELKFDESAQIDQLIDSRTSSVEQNSIAGGVAYRRRWNENWISDLEIFETDYKLQAINVNVLDDQRFLQENKVSETSTKISTVHVVNPEMSFKGGYHFVETEVTNLDDVDTPLFRLLVSEVVRTHAGFLQMDWRSNNGQSRFKIGGRYSYIDKFRKSLVEPRFSFNQQFMDYFTLEVMGEMKHQITSQVINFQNDFLGIEKRRWQLSNDADIPVLRSKQLSVGLSFDNDGWLIDAVGYYKDVDGITSQSQGFQNQYEFSRAKGSYLVKGLDLLIRKQFQGISSWISYGFMNSDYTFKELQPNAFRSNYDISHALTAGISFKIRNLQLAAGLNWHSGRPTTRPLPGEEITDNTINYGPTNEDELDDYLRLDLSAMYNFNLGLKTKAKVGISVWNILNRENSINNFYRIENEALSETIQRSLGITPNAMIRVLF